MARVKPSSLLMELGSSEPTLGVTSGLQYWFKADAIQGLANAAPVTAWTDSAAGATVSQVDPLQQPTYRTNVINGKPVVRFDGGDRLFRADSIADTTITGFFVCNKTGDVAEFKTLFRLDEFIALQRLDSTDLWGAYTTTTLNSTVQLTSTFKVLTVVANANQDYILGTNGTDVAVSNSNSVGANSSDTIGIGGEFAGTIVQAMIGDIAEIVIYNRILSASERDLVEKYLGSKYGIVIN